MCTFLAIIDKWSLNMNTKDFCPIGASWSFLYFSYNLEIVCKEIFHLVLWVRTILPDGRSQEMR